MDLEKVIDDITPDKTLYGLPLGEAEKQEIEDLIIEKYREFQEEMGI